ncbi:DMT family transporter [Ideonella azotifigens]|uniref:DMT family transporter n=2 Tax=Ideonella azotifigens TaxID=513160 RepID=A0ABN1KA35_9BURK|nr:DMT family transporter [Ideonella azotifigens]MCD2338942.1 DMT family transporter [Ideonella azotifigens]
MDSTQTSRSSAMLSLIFATVAWGSLFLVGKPLLRELDPAWFTLLRYTGATLVLLALLRLRGPLPLASLRADALPFALMGLAGFGFFSVLVLWGLAHSQPSHGAVIMATMPITTQLVRWWRDGVAPTRSTLFGTALALLGVCIVAGVGLPHEAANASTWRGDLAAWVGTLGWIAYTRGSARWAQLDVLSFSTWTAVAAWPLLLAAAVLSSLLGWSRWPTPGLVADHALPLAYIGLVPSALAVLAFNRGVKTLGAVTGTAFLNLVPVSALLLGALLGHVPNGRELLGVAMVIGALLLHTASQRQTASGSRLPTAPAAACAR